MMKDFFDVLRARRSVRSYTDQIPDEAQLALFLEAGIQAPSAGNMQPWEFVVVQANQDLKTAIVNTTYAGNSHEDGKPQGWLSQPPILVVVCGNIKRSAARYGWDAAQRLAYQDISAAIENMLLAATAMDLGSCWIGGFSETALTELLDLPTGVVPIAILPLGYPARVSPAPPRLEIDDVVRARL
jgi:nitroreductase